MSSVVTKTGDRGTTRFFSGESVGKNHLQVDTYGTLDELNSAMGLAKSFCQNSTIHAQIHHIQKRLFTLGMELATDSKKQSRLKDKINKQDITEIEFIITQHEAELDLPPEFIIPGKNSASAAIDVARTIARRLERHMWQIKDEGLFSNEDALVWVNRLSDFLFIAARVEEC